MRVRRVVVNIYQDGSSGVNSQYTFNYPDCKLAFNVTQKETDSPSNCTIRVSGISKETYAIFNTQKNSGYIGVQRVEVYYGYDSELSLVFSGTIDRVMYVFNNGSQDLLMNVTKNARKFHNEVRTIALSGKQSIKSAVLAICKQFEYTARFGEGDFEAIEIGRVGDTTTFENALKSVLPKDYGYYVNEKEIFVYHKDKSTPNLMTVWPQNGMLAYPTEDSKGESTTIKTILIPTAEAGMKIKVPIDNIWFSDIDTGKYKEYVVKHFSSSFSNGIGTTEFQCEGGLGV